MPIQNLSRAKPYTLEFEQRPKYLYACVKGEKDSLEISLQYWKEIADECWRTGYRKVFIEEDINGEMSIIEMYQFTSEIPNIGFSGIRVAFVDRRLNQQELNKFGELVATNRGLNGKIFNSSEEAEEWLLSN
ncbi:hypothetical protein BH24ACI1_BH24ACI1_14470 [soil metagenome]|jgi:hypothetical protein